jgi:REP element-mobilizing transposase RayT
MGKVELSEIGRFVGEEWIRSEKIRKEVRLDEFVVMPDHLHGIIWWTPVGPPVAAHCNAQLPDYETPSLFRSPRSLGSFISGFKGTVTRRANSHWETAGLPVWQRNYYDRVVRNRRELKAFRWYIRTNPSRWDE